MRRLLLVALLALAAVSAYAAQLTLTLTAEQVAVVVWKWNQVDPGHSQFPTGQDFAANAFSQLIDGWRNQRVAANRGDFCVKFRAANQTQRDAACAAVGEASGCDPCGTQ